MRSLQLLTIDRNPSCYFCRSSSHDTILNGAATELSTSFTVCNDGIQSQDEEEVHAVRRRMMEVRLEPVMTGDAGRPPPPSAIGSEKRAWFIPLSTALPPPLP